MHAAGGHRVRVRRRAVAVTVALAAGLTGCGSSDTTSPSTSAVTTAAAPTSGDTTAADSSTTGAGGPAATTTTGSGFEDATDGPRTAPPDGTGTALLRAVRVGRNDGFERIVFEFVGTSRPGYRIRWVDGPITADGSGEVVTVAGAAHLEMILEPASGVDPDDASPTYAGPDRIPVSQQTKLLTDLVRTGDFEAVLTWVAGAKERVPFRVQVLTDPTRLVVDLQT